VYAHTRMIYNTYYTRDGNFPRKRTLHRKQHNVIICTYIQCDNILCRARKQVPAQSNTYSPRPRALSEVVSYVSRLKDDGNSVYYFFREKNVFRARHTLHNSNTRMSCVSRDFRTRTGPHGYRVIRTYTRVSIFASDVRQFGHENNH